MFTRLNFTERSSFSNCFDPGRSFDVTCPSFSVECCQI